MSDDELDSWRVANGYMTEEERISRAYQRILRRQMERRWFRTTGGRT